MADLENILSSNDKEEKDYNRRFFIKEAFKAKRIKARRLAHSLRYFASSNTDESFAQHYREIFLKSDKEINDEELDKYKIHLDIRRRGKHSGKNFQRRYYNSRYNFCLTYNDNVIASVGFDVINKGILIKHLQGSREEKDRLNQFYWREALLTYAIDWAAENEIKEIRIISEESSTELPDRKFYMRYQGRQFNDLRLDRFRYYSSKLDFNEDYGEYLIKFEYKREGFLWKTIGPIGVFLVQKLLHTRYKKDTKGL